MNIQPLIEGQYFHIYNRGVNGENIFKEKRNYYYFLQQYKLYCSDILSTLSYCLLKNHFHILIFIKEKVEVARKDGQGMFKLDASKQLGHFFNSYAQSINKAYQRTGPLFESPFERKLVDNDDYLLSLIRYCHQNAQLHGFVDDFKEWEFSSYTEILSNNNSLVISDEVLKRFGSLIDFENSHKQNMQEKEAKEIFIEK